MPGAATSPAWGLSSSASSAPRGSDSMAAIDPARGPIPKRCSASAATAFAESPMKHVPTVTSALLANAERYLLYHELASGLITSASDPRRLFSAARPQEVLFATLGLEQTWPTRVALSAPHASAG